MQTASLRDMVAALDLPLSTVARPQQPRIIDKAPTLPNVTGEWRSILDDLYAGLETPPDDRVVDSALAASDHAKLHFERVNAIERMAKNNREEVKNVRDMFRYKEVIRQPAEAKAKLKSMAIQERFLVTDEMARNMQSLCSYHNNKPNGKRYKTERIGGSASMLAVWRTR